MDGDGSSLGVGSGSLGVGCSEGEGDGVRTDGEGCSEGKSEDEDGALAEGDAPAQAENVARSKTAERISAISFFTSSTCFRVKWE
ncbi:MAG: hypothetical protein LBI44_00160 [Oscillospiraceae bacterium]|jgi:hypothetical protein|nr:hypothetical protein [Oscillospiraceae bacterium]